MKNLILLIILLFNYHLFSQDAGIIPLSAISKDPGNVNSKYQNGNINNLFSGNIFYGVNVVTFNYSTFQTVTFNTNSPEFLNIKASYYTNIFAGGLGPDGYIYAVDNGVPLLFGDELLVKIDTATGNVVHTVGPIVAFGNETFTELTYDFKNNTMYASSFGIANSVLRSTLYTININNGQTQSIRQINNASAIISIVFDSEEKLYGIDIAPPDALVTINLITGNATQVGFLDFDANYASAMIFDENDNLYFATINNVNFVSELRRLDKNDGSSISTSYFPEISQITVLAKTMTLTGITAGNEILPGSFSLYQNFPNPFNPITKIKFDIPQDARGETRDVRVIVYDALGKKVTNLVNDKLSAGSYEVEFDGSNLSSGIYFYRIVIHSGKFSDGVSSEVRKMILLR